MLPAMNGDSTREHWSSRFGFTLAAIGSAVGLGNMWRFSYMTAENGGAAFVFLYLAMTALIGLPVMLAELALGRGASRSPIQALAHYGGPRWRPLGILFVASGFLILAYYSVIAGWTVRYAAGVFGAGFPADAGARFTQVAAGWDAVAWHLGFMAVTAWVVSGGIRAGIERTALVLMPLLGALVLGLAIYASTLDGAGPGYRYYFATSFAAIFDWKVLADAAGQAFFSLSLGMGAMLTYASYLHREHDLPREAITISLADFSVAFVAGMVVFPLLFALGLQSQVIGTEGTAREIGSLGALFVVLPAAFHAMGAVGRVVGLLFFVALVVGALTSAISLLEVVVASAMDGLGWQRRKAAWLLGAAIAALGVPAALDTHVLGVMDQIGGNIFLLAGGLMLSVFVGWVAHEPAEEATVGTSFGGLGAWRWLLRWLVPPVLGAVLVVQVAKLAG